MDIKQKLKDLIIVLDALNSYSIEGFPSFKRSVENSEIEKVRNH